MATPSGSVDSQLAQLQAQIDDLANRMMAANRAGDQATVDSLRGTFRDLSAQATALRVTLSQGDAPSPVLVKLDQLSDKLIAVGAAVGEKVGDTLNAAVTASTTLIRLLPILVVAALVVAGLYLWQKGKRV